MTGTESELKARSGMDFLLIPLAFYQLSRDGTREKQQHTRRDFPRHTTRTSRSRQDGKISPTIHEMRLTKESVRFQVG